MPHATQAVSLDQPSMTSAILDIAGLPIVGFSAFGKNWLNFNAPLSLDAANDFTIYYVGITSIGSNTSWASLCSSTTNTIIALYNTSGAKMQDTAGTSQTLTASYPASTAMCARARKSGTSYFWKENGATETTATNGTLSTFTLPSIGIGNTPGRTNYGGFLGEVLVFSRSLTTLEMSTVETDLLGRWALHP